MDKKIKDLLNLTKKKNEKLYSLLSSLDESIIKDNYGTILRVVNEPINNKYTIEFKYNKKTKTLDWNYVPNSPKAKFEETIEKIKSNYLIHLLNNEEYLLNINEIYNNPLRKSYITALKKIKSDWKEKEKLKWIWVYGPSYAGKSHIAKSFGNWIAKNESTVAFIHMPTTILQLKSLIKGFDEKKEIENIFNQAKSAQLLILDELIHSNFTPWIKDAFFLSLIEYRRVNNKPIIFTSNYDLENFTKGLANIDLPKQDKLSSERIKNRILEKAIIIKLEK